MLQVMTLNVTLLVKQSPAVPLPTEIVPPEVNAPPFSETCFMHWIDTGFSVTLALELAVNAELSDAHRAFTVAVFGTV